MRFTSLLSNLVLEQSRFKVLYDKMVATPQGKVEGDRKPAKGLMDFETLKAIILADPTTVVPEGKDIDTITVEDLDNVKVGKYSQWLLKNFVAPKLSELGLEGEVDPKSREYKSALKEFKRLFLEDLYKTTDDLKKFERAKQYLPQEQRDINKFTVKSLFDTLRDFQIPEKKKAEIEKKEAKKSREGLKHAGGEILFEGPNWTLIRVSDKGQVGKDAAIYYGGFHEHDKGESRWCTSSPGLTYFDGYIKDGPLYVIFPNDDKGQVGQKTGLPKERYQFHFPSNQFMDRDDRQVNLVEKLNGPMEELKEFFKPEFAKGLTSKAGDIVNIEYPQSSAGKFVALYGFEELFSSLPENISQLKIYNKSNEHISLNVPSSVTRFKNLETLLLSNLVKTVPDNLGDLKGLILLSLPNNKDLVSVPDSIMTIPNLSLVNLQNSNPNVKLPKELEEIGSEDGFFVVG